MSNLQFWIIKWIKRYCPHICLLCKYRNVCTFREELEEDMFLG